MTRRRVTQADLAELRKRAPRGKDSNSVGVIVRRIVDPPPPGMSLLPTPPNTAMEEAMIAAALADFRKDGKIRRLIFDSLDPAGGRLLEPRGRANG